GRRLAAEELARDTVLGQKAEERRVGVADESLQGGRVITRRTYPRAQPARGVLDQRAQDGLLVGEQLVHGGGTQARSPDDVTQRGRVVPDLGEHPARGAEDLRPLLLPG